MDSIYILYIMFIWSACQIHHVEINAQDISSSPETTVTVGTGNITSQSDTTASAEIVTNNNSTINETTTDSSLPITSFITIGVYFGVSSILAVYFCYMKHKKPKQKEVEKPIRDGQSDDDSDVEPPKPTVDVYITAVPDVVVVESSSSSSSSENLDNKSDKSDHTGDVTEIVVTDTEGDDECVSNLDITTSGESIHTDHTVLPEIEDTGDTRDSNYLTADSVHVADKNGDHTSFLDNGATDTGIVSTPENDDISIHVGDASVPEKDTSESGRNLSNNTDGYINAGFNTDDIDDRDLPDTIPNNTPLDSDLVIEADIHSTVIDVNVMDTGGLSETTETNEDLVDDNSVETILADDKDNSRETLVSQI